MLARCVLVSECVELQLVCAPKNTLRCKNTSASSVNSATRCYSACRFVRLNFHPTFAMSADISRAARFLMWLHGRHLIVSYWLYIFGTHHAARTVIPRAAPAHCPLSRCRHPPQRTVHGYPLTVTSRTCAAVRPRSSVEHDPSALHDQPLIAAPSHCLTPAEQRQ